MAPMPAQPQTPQLMDALRNLELRSRADLISLAIAESDQAWIKLASRSGDLTELCLGLFWAQGASGEPWPALCVLVHRWSRPRTACIVLASIGRTQWSCSVRSSVPWARYGGNAGGPPSLRNGDYPDALADPKGRGPDPQRVSALLESLRDPDAVSPPWRPLGPQNQSVHRPCPALSEHSGSPGSADPGPIASGRPRRRR